MDVTDGKAFQADDSREVDREVAFDDPWAEWRTCTFQ